MNELLQYILIYTCAVPACIGIFVYRKIQKPFRIIVYILIAAVITEIFNEPFLQPLEHEDSTAINLFSIVNLALHLLLFTNTAVISKRNAYVIFVLYILFMSGDMILSKTNISGSLFTSYLVGYAIILALCIEGSIRKIYNTDKPWYRDTLFLYACINIIYAAFFELVYGIRFFGVTDGEVHLSLREIHLWVNAACYILTIWPVWFSIKQRTG